MRLLILGEVSSFKTCSLVHYVLNETKQRGVWISKSHRFAKLQSSPPVYSVLAVHFEFSEKTEQEFPVTGQFCVLDFRIHCSFR